MKKTFAFVVLFLFYTLTAFSQTVFFNTISDSIYALTGAPGSCTYKNLGVIGVPNVKNNIFSIAAHKDTLYYLTEVTSTNLPAIYYFKVSNPSKCTLLTTLPRSNYNSFTIDKNGILYCVDNSAALYSYDSYNKIGPTMLGYLPKYPAGDLIFYKNKLLFTANGDGIYEINLANTRASKQYMLTPNQNFIGLISFPYDCNNNKVYGIDANSFLTELDLEAKKVVGQLCKLANGVYDAASSVEDGTTTGITLDTIIVQKQCSSAKADSTNLQVNSYSAALGQLTYTLDNVISNQSGSFRVPYGLHHIHIANGAGCTKDSDIIIPKPSPIIINFNNQNPASCSNLNGVISASVQSVFPPYYYSINNGPFQSSGNFTNLSEGRYTISVIDGGQCQTDTTIQLKYIQQPYIYSSIVVEPTYCNAKSGKISIVLPQGTNPTSIKISINNGAKQSSLQFSNLDSGKYLISVFDASGCKKDTTIIINQIINAEPIITILTTNQQCAINNGEFVLAVSGSSPPYSISVNNSSFLQQTVFNNLWPGTYIFKIRDKDLCEWDTSAPIKKYVAVPFTWQSNTVKAKCSLPTSGSITVTVSGTEPPYSFQLNNKTYRSGEKASNLLYGNYIVSFLNKDGCILDTASIYVDVEPSPECEQVWVPNAFTPNGDGKNDLLKPIVSAMFKNAVFYIYNRYGQLLFSDTKGIGWDGKLNGIIQPVGTYIWTIKYNNAFGEAKTLNGTVLLMR